MTRGKVSELRANLIGGVKGEEKDNEMIATYCKSPSYTLEEAKDIKPKVANAIITAIMSISLDITQTEMQKMITQVAIDEADTLKKKITTIE